MVHISGALVDEPRMCADSRLGGVFATFTAYVRDHKVDERIVYLNESVDADLGGWAKRLDFLLTAPDFGLIMTGWTSRCVGTSAPCCPPSAVATCSPTTGGCSSLRSETSVRHRVTGREAPPGRARGSSAVEGLSQHSADVGDVSGCIVQQDRGAQAVGCRREGVDGSGSLVRVAARSATSPPPSRDRAQRGAAGGQGGEFAFGERAVAAGPSGLRDEFGQRGELVVRSLDDVADSGGVDVGDAAERRHQEVVEGGEVVGGQTRGDAGLLGHRAVGDAGRAVACDDREGGLDDLGAAFRAPCSSSVTWSSIPPSG